MRVSRSMGSDFPDITRGKPNARPSTLVIAKTSEFYISEFYLST